ncbi:MAG: hypothetical protein HUU15_19215 [Candidatus Brocadiae bacterium]|nr:hypothetical protein [Candidatus Brocadiia bacterium]
MARPHIRPGGMAAAAVWLAMELGGDDLPALIETYRAREQRWEEWQRCAAEADF